MAIVFELAGKACCRSGLIATSGQCPTLPQSHGQRSEPVQKGGIKQVFAGKRGGSHVSSLKWKNVFGKSSFRFSPRLIFEKSPLKTLHEVLTQGR